MNTLQRVLINLALIAGILLVVWLQQQRLEHARSQLAGTTELLTAAHQIIEQHQLAIAAKTAELEQERTAQIGLRKQQEKLQQQLNHRQKQIEDLKHENEELRDWARVRLPDVARRLRQRPAITGADGYQAWLSGSDALHPDGNGAEHQRRATEQP